MRSQLVNCATCRLPGRVTFDKNGNVQAVYFNCKCHRPNLEEGKPK